MSSCREKKDGVAVLFVRPNGQVELNDVDSEEKNRFVGHLKQRLDDSDKVLGLGGEKK